MSDLFGFVLELLAVLVLIVGPVSTYIIARRKVGPEVLLADINAVKGWSEQRANYEKELTDLHNALMEEQEKNRRNRQEYYKTLADLEDENERLRDSLEELSGE